MGMAASQARFLGLTARKSNVEYQGQQVNQQRTALATESSNLFHQMMSLDVPTPPVSTDYYKTVYTLDDSAFGNSGNYSIENLTKTFNGTNNYTVKLKTTETKTAGTSNTFLFTKVTRSPINEPKDENNAYTYITKLNGSFVTYNPEDCIAWVEDTSDGNNKVLKTSENKIYLIDDVTKQRFSESNDGYNAVIEEMINDGIIKKDEDGNIYEKQDDGTYSTEASSLYFFQDKSGKNCYMTQSQLDRLTKDAFNNPDYTAQTEGDTAIISGAYAQLYYPYASKNDYYYEVNADIDSSSTGRYTSITIADPPETEDGKSSYPSNLKGKTFSITCSSEYDEEAYKDAYNDYEYSKNVYEQMISNINSQTEIIQQEDKQLELRLQQLDTEQESIKTEMESVQKVVEENVQKTFDAFA